MADQVHVGFIGLGRMGGAMAERLLSPGLALHVFDPSPAAAARLADKGAALHGSPAAVANAAALVLACLPSPAVSETVALGPGGVAEGRAVRTYVEMSTIGSASIGRIASGLAACGIGVVDAPISGGPPGARAGTLAIMPAGAPEDLDHAAPAFARLARLVRPVGTQPGAGQTMKLVNNLVAAGNMACLFEALVMGAKAGLDPDAMLAVLNASTGRSMISTDMVPRSVLTGRFDFGATVAVMDKDVSLGLAEAAALSVPMWTLEQAARLWRFAAVQGRAGEDITALIRMMEEWAGAAVRSAAGPDGASDG